MKIKMIFLTFLGLLSCARLKIAKENMLIPGEGFNDIKIGKTELSDIIKIYGNTFRTDTFYSKLSADSIDLKTQDNLQKEIYSIQYAYDSLGLSFYFRAYYTKLYLIAFSSPFKAKTNKGISLNKSTFNDVIKIYGDKEWSCTDEKIMKIYDGIWFYQDFKDTIPISDDKLIPYLDLKVKEISIMEKDK